MLAIAPLAATVGSFAAGVTSATAVSNIVASHVVTTNVVMKGVYAVGAAVTGLAIGDAVSKQSDIYIRELCDTLETLVSQARKS